jgi:hypothetical protein
MTRSPLVRFFPSVVLCLVGCSASNAAESQDLGSGAAAGTLSVGGATATGGSSGTAGGTGGGGTGGTLGAGGAISLQTGGASGSGGTGTMCGLQYFDLERKPADVMLLLDRSASQKDPPEDYVDENGMAVTTPKWDLMLPALLQIIPATDAMVNWGMKTFPEGGTGDGDACLAESVTDRIDVPIAEMNAQAVTDAISAATDDGDGTPTGDAVRQVVNYMKTIDDTNPKYILLATDGEPSCVDVGPNDGSEGQEAARPYAVAAIEESVAAGIPVFVMGVGTNKDTAVETLDNMAVAGGRPAPSANPRANAFYLGNSTEQLTAALEAIAIDVKTCVFPLRTKPDDPSNIAVNVDGQKVPPDDTQVEGWSYADPMKTVVEIYGSWCERVKVSGSDTVQIIYGCPDINVR